MSNQYTLDKESRQLLRHELVGEFEDEEGGGGRGGEEENLAL
jgi:hypothetical protein